MKNFLKLWCESCRMYEYGWYDEIEPCRCCQGVQKLVEKLGDFFEQDRSPAPTIEKTGYPEVAGGTVDEWWAGSKDLDALKRRVAELLQIATEEGKRAPKAPAKPFLTAADLVMLQGMKVRL